MATQGVASWLTVLIHLLLFVLVAGLQVYTKFNCHVSGDVDRSYSSDSLADIGEENPRI